MKVSVPIVFAAAAGLVNAAPIIIAYVPKPRPDLDAGAWAQNVRWGHAVANAGFLPPVMTTPSPTGYYRAYEPTPMPQYSYMPTPTAWPMVTAPNPTFAPIPTGYWRQPDYIPDPEWIALGERLRASVKVHDDGSLKASMDAQNERARVWEEDQRKTGKGGCRMRKMRHKSLQWGNKLRVILGLPPIEEFGTVRKNPSVLFTAYTSTFDSNGVEHREYAPIERWLGPQHRHRTRPLHHVPPFHVRLTRALSSLGPWEGRAVSFVLGCGLGVLLRMLYVFGVLIVRGVRCQRAQRRIALVEDSVIFVADVKEPVVVEALPEYAEKAEATEAEAPQTNNAH